MLLPYNFIIVCSILLLFRSIIQESMINIRVTVALRNALRNMEKQLKALSKRPQRSTEAGNEWKELTAQKMTFT